MDGAVQLIALLLLLAFIAVVVGLGFATVVAVRYRKGIRSLVWARRAALLACVVLLPALFVALIAANTGIGEAPLIVALIGMAWSSILVAHLSKLIRRSHDEA